MISIDMSQIDFGSVVIGALSYILIATLLQKVSGFVLAVLCETRNESRHNVIENLVQKSRTKYEKMLPHWDVRAK